MEVLHAIWRFSIGRNTHVAAGQEALERIHDVLVKTLAKYDRVPHALTREEMTPIQAICDQLVFANFRLTVPDLRDSGRDRSKHVRYKHVYEDKVVSMGIFILPPGVSIPLHDHPRMSVISRVLYGSMHVKTYDLVTDGTFSPTDNKWLARLRMDTVTIAPHTTELLPDCGNLHQLVGGDDIGCAFLDIITPPYDSKDGRDCTYFQIVDTIDNAEGASDKLYVLESYTPQDFDVVSEPYHGPHLQR